MPKIRCHYLDCTYLDERYCCAGAIELNPDSGCLTYAPDDEAGTASWDEDGDEEWDGGDVDDDSDDLWASDDDEPEDDDEEDSDPY